MKSSYDHHVLKASVSSGAACTHCPCTVWRFLALSTPDPTHEGFIISVMSWIRCSHIGTKVLTRFVTQLTAVESRAEYFICLLSPLETQSAKLMTVLFFFFSCHSRTSEAAALINLCTHSWPIKCWLIMYQIRQKRDNYLSFNWKPLHQTALFRHVAAVLRCHTWWIGTQWEGEKHRGLIDGEVRGREEWQVHNPVENAGFNLLTKFIFAKSNRIGRPLAWGF